MYIQDGNTALMVALNRGFREVLHVLLQHNPDVNIPDNVSRFSTSVSTI